jgi:transglutaminase-like putative cysteine protease
VKPIPEAVQAAFPCEAGNLRERPWWYRSRHGVGGADCLRRTDDPHTTAPTVEHAAIYDAANPLPHPGFRAGQVWAAENGESTVIMRATSTRVWVCDDVPPPEFTRAYPYLMADPACPWLAPWSPSEVKP